MSSTPQFTCDQKVQCYTIFYSLLLSERKKDPSLESPEDKSVQDWDLKDVIFVEDKRNIPVGKVLKVSFQTL